MQARKVVKQFKIIIPINLKPYPDVYEEKAARILADKFQSDVFFVSPINSLHTPDLKIIRTGEFWEIKNIRGNSKNTIEDNLKSATWKYQTSYFSYKG